jgi:hypothetical protein
MVDYVGNKTSVHEENPNTLFFRTEYLQSPAGQQMSGH